MLRDLPRVCQLRSRRDSLLTDLVEQVGRDTVCWSPRNALPRGLLLAVPATAHVSLKDLLQEELDTACVLKGPQEGAPATAPVSHKDLLPGGLDTVRVLLKGLLRAVRDIARALLKDLLQVCYVCFASKFNANQGTS